MKIVVCIKTVPDTETRVKVTADGRTVSMEGVNFITSPYDEIAIEEALLTREKQGQGEIVLVAIGDDECVKILRNGLALGADRAVQVKDPAVSGLDPLQTARILAAVIQAEGAEIAYFGKQGVGQDYSQVPALTAELLGWPQVSMASTLAWEGRTLTATREIEGGEEVLQFSLPAVVSAQKGLNNPRYPNMKGVLAAKKKPVDVKTLADLGLQPSGEPSWTVAKVELPPSRPAGRLLDGEPEQQVRELIRLLREEAKVL